MPVLCVSELGFCRGETYFSPAIGRKWGETSFSPGKMAESTGETQMSPKKLREKFPKLRISVFLLQHELANFFMFISVKAK